MIIGPISHPADGDPYVSSYIQLAGRDNDLIYHIG